MHTPNKSTQKENQHSEHSALNPDLPDSWKLKFEIIEKAGGIKHTKVLDLLDTSALSFKERYKINFNIFGFLFAPFYYLTKGMWKKAIVLSVISVVLAIIFELVLNALGIKNSTATNFVSGAIFASRANIDYYKKMVLGDNGWW